MMFGSEPPLYLKPIGRRGLRRHEADELQHYPNYVHPMCQQPDSAAYACEAYRLHPSIKAVHELRHQHDEARKAKENVLRGRVMRRIRRDEELRDRREREYERQEQHNENITGLSRRNEPGNGLDTVTMQCRTVEARQAMEHKRAVDEHLYFRRQKYLVERSNGHGFNIITGEPLKPVVVPPLPEVAPVGEGSRKSASRFTEVM
ncbi:Variant surface glycoprotein [Trypanosoma congolense IL3000]|uniref:Variant surface glycoprotein n=1 Tax=Trypanosoma congolense (strain IL3000) TaxID=1068625 RepID=F9WFX5_TRYCI|nr:Variant surface glycoprotein [Trypanosoma congolense IL3000]